MLLALVISSCQTVDLASLPPAGERDPDRSSLRVAQGAVRAASRESDPGKAAGLALLAAEIAWDLDWRRDGSVLSHECGRAERVYNDALIQLMEIVADEGVFALPAGGVVEGPRDSYRLRLGENTHRALALYPGYRPSSEVRVGRGFDRRITREGMGLPLVAFDRDGFLQSLLVKPDTFRRAEGYSMPLTALLTFESPVGGEPRNATLSVVDPRQVEELIVEGRSVPLAADFTAPLATSFPRFGATRSALRAAFRPAGWLSRTDLYALEHPDDERIPLVLVHGLFSTPDMWKNLINELNAEPGIGGRYQFYSFTYPTSLPPSFSGTLLRDSLDELREVHGFSDGYVLLGHSMGGILIRTKATNSGRHIWDYFLGDNADKAWESVPEDDIFRRSVVFEADPAVRRLVFVAVPHRGSPVATRAPVRFLTRLIRFPVELTGYVASSPLVAFGVMDERRLPSSADGLSPSSHFLQGLAPLPTEAPAHSIIGNRGLPGPLEESSDGIVPYWSSHLPFAVSELVVPSDHSATEHPATLEEIKRLLLQDAEGGQ